MSVFNQAAFNQLMTLEPTGFQQTTLPSHIPKKPAPLFLKSVLEDGRFAEGRLKAAPAGLFLGAMRNLKRHVSWER